MRIMVCDDDELFINDFCKLLEKEFLTYGERIDIIGTNSGAEALEMLSRDMVSVLFLDIDMPGLNGFSVAEKLLSIHPTPRVIFVSALDNLVFCSFAFQPFWFLRKSHLDEVQQIVQNILRLRTEKQMKYQVTIAGNHVVVPIQEIAYFESNGHYITLHAINQTLRYKAKLGEIEAQLKYEDFIRCHVGFLVNCRSIRIIDKNSLILSNDIVIPISRGRIEETQTKFMMYMRKYRI